jgi:hypothetical protein
MAEVDDLFNCFDEEEEEKQPTVPIVVDDNENSGDKAENE